MTRKDKLCINILKMQERFGKEAFNIVPDTFVLPEEEEEFKEFFDELRRVEGRKPYWIVKPNSSSQGKGIYLIEDWNEIRLGESCIISKYIPNPLLINCLLYTSPSPRDRG